MADQKATQLTELTTVADGDILYIVDDPGGTPISKKITKLNLVGSGGNTFARVVKKVDETVTSSSTLQDDDELKVALSANKTYGIMLFILLESSFTPDYKHAFTIPSGATITGNHSTAELYHGNAASGDISADMTASASGTSTATISHFLIMGRVIVGGTAGDVQYQWAQDVSDAAATKVLEGSYFVVWEEI